MNLKQNLLVGGVILQLSILAITLYHVHDLNRTKESYGVTPEINPFDLSVEKEMEIPFKHYVVGTGIVKPSSDYVVVDTAISGVVDKVFVKPGDTVKQGELLFHINDSAYTYSLQEKIAEYETALAKLDLMKEKPSSTVLQAKEKEIIQAKIKQEQHEREHAVFESLLIQNAVSKSEKEEQETLLKISQTEVEKMLCEYEEMKKGPSPGFLRVGQSEIAEKEANVRTVEKRIEECFVKAPVSGKVLKVNINPGQHIDPMEMKAIVLGSEDPLHLHVFIDEKDAWRVAPTKSLKAIAVHKNNPKMHFILQFDSVKPCLQDAGKLELIFAFDRGKAPIYLEQSLNVYIESASLLDTSYLDYQFKVR